VSTFSATHRTNTALSARSSFRNPSGPSNVRPSGKTPEASMAALPSFSRHAPTASKCSNANPIGSIRWWQEAHTTFARCCSICCRRVPFSCFCCSNSGTSGGGGGGGVFSSCSNTNLPRFTGEERVAFDASARMLACVSIPPRWAGAFTRTNSAPFTPSMP
jgi:hypothetical protein